MQQDKGDECCVRQRSEERGMLKLYVTPVPSKTAAGTHRITRGLITLTVSAHAIALCVRVFLFHLSD